VIWPACQTTNDEFETFCRKCGSPIGTTATLAPVPSIQTQGFLFRKAVDKPPNLIALIGMWFLFAPTIPVGVYAATYLILYQRGLSYFLLFWVFVGLTYCSVVILYRITKNYIVARAKPTAASKDKQQTHQS
jgi:hypothetical protein